MEDISHFNSVTDLSATQFDQCYKLVRNIKGMYEGSGMGWDSKAKKDEMKDPQMEYLIVGEGDRVDAFASYMRDTEEDGIHLTYLYELHVGKSKQGKSIGSTLLNAVKKNSVGTIWLTVFNMNKRALQFYEKHGFNTVDVIGEGKVGWSIMEWTAEEGEGQNLVHTRESC